MSNVNQEIGTVLIVLTLLFSVIIIFVTAIIIFSQRKIRQKQTESFNAILTAVENEKERIARDLHDQTGPILSKISMNMDVLTIQSDDNEWLKFKVENRHLIDNLISDIKSTSYDLMPRVLQSHNLLIAIEDFCEMMERGSKIEIKYNSQGELPPLKKQSELNIYRVVQEILNNAIKYANATIIHVNTKATKKHLILEIFDDGDGFEFDFAKLNSSNSIGLQNIRSRIELLQGEMSFTTAPKKGTYYYIKFKISNLET